MAVMLPFFYFFNNPIASERELIKLICLPLLLSTIKAFKLSLSNLEKSPTMINGIRYWANF